MADNDYYYYYNIFEVVDIISNFAVLEDWFWNTFTERSRISARYLLCTSLSGSQTRVKKLLLWITNWQFFSEIRAKWPEQGRWLMVHGTDPDVILYQFNFLGIGA